MRLSHLMLSLAFVEASGKLPTVQRNRLLSPEDVGAYHTDAFELLGNKYSLQKPKSIFHAIADVGGILAGYCPEEDSECITNAYKITKKEFEMRAKGEEREITYPDDFDPRVKESINAMVSHVESIEELNLDDVINSLRKTKEQLEDMTDVKESDRLVGLTGASVAMESTKLWHSTHYDDEHPLHDMIDYFDPQTGKRRLQIDFMALFTECEIDPAIIMADVQAAISMGGMASIQTEIQSVGGVFDLMFLMPVISASAAAFMGDDETYYNYYNYYYDGNDKDCRELLEVIGIDICW